MVREISVCGQMEAMNRIKDVAIMMRRMVLRRKFLIFSLAAISLL